MRTPYGVLPGREEVNSIGDSTQSHSSFSNCSIIVEHYCPGPCLVLHFKASGSTQAHLLNWSSHLQTIVLGTGHYVWLEQGCGSNAKIAYTDIFLH